MSGTGKHLLVTTGRSATRIANETGFCDLPHMIKVFRAAEGVTPDVFRRSGREASAVSALPPLAGSS